MKVLDVIQGSLEWHAERARHFTASEAPAMMGASKHLSRDELLRQKAAGGAQKEVSAAKKKLFERGHKAEAIAREKLELELEDELYPVTAVDDEGYLLASFDGLNMVGDTIFEHKLWSQALAEQIALDDLEPHYYWQLEHQLLVSGAERVIFVASDPDKGEWAQMEYRPVPGRAKQLLDGWAQFERDMAAGAPAAAAAAPVGRELMELPALSVELVGEVRRSNLAVYKGQALEFIRAINTDLRTDQDFADAEKTVKFCDRAERELEACKKAALAQTADIDELFRTVDALREELRSKRLELNKQIKDRKHAIKLEIALEARRAYQAHISELNARLARVSLPEIPTDFNSAMKGKRTVATLQSAANDELARAKIAATNLAEHIEANLLLADSIMGAYTHLFPDLAALVQKPGEDMAAVMRARIAEFEASAANSAEGELSELSEKSRQASLSAANEVARKGEKTPPAEPRPSFARALKAWQQAHDVSDEALRELEALLAAHVDLRGAA